TQGPKPWLNRGGFEPREGIHSRPIPEPWRSSMQVCMARTIPPQCPSLPSLVSNCGTTRTPLWRRSPQGATICNACGLYQKARNAARPTSLKKPQNVVQPSPQRPVMPKTNSTGSSKPSSNAGATYVAADQTPTGTCPGGGRCNGTGGA